MPKNLFFWRSLAKKILVKSLESIDPRIFFAYNSVMGEKCKKNTIRRVLQIVLTLFTLLWTLFIWGNSIRTGAQSSAQSSTVVEVVQKVAQVLAPESPIANATGEQYEKLHFFIRKAAHYTEYAVLGALLCWCYFSYTSKYKHVYLPILAMVIVPTLDECIQLFTSARAGTVQDVLLDLCGGASGFFLAWVTVFLGIYFYKKRKAKQKDVTMYEFIDEKDLF